MSPGGMASEKEDLIQNWLMLPSVAAGFGPGGARLAGGVGPAVSESAARGVPAPAASSVESCSHLANHQASASHNGITVRSAFLIPRAIALTSEHAISRSWS